MTAPLPPRAADDLSAWLREDDPTRLAALWRAADDARRLHVGDAVHLRGLVEVSNHCRRACAYCGVRSPRADLPRYRMTADEVLACARRAVALGYGTLVLQAGEDPGLTAPWVAGLLVALRAETPLAVTLSLGERDEHELALWRAAGADRYLLRFETSDPALFARVHPPRPGRVSDRPAALRRLRALGYEAGGGFMVGLPGQTWRTLAEDLLLCRALDLDMIGVGPYLPHPAAPLGPPAPGPAQVPNDAATTLKAVALARLLCPTANIPATTALATVDPSRGREDGLSRGANVVMPNLTPARYRALYEIYPGKACLHETAEVRDGYLRARIAYVGRVVGRGPGGRREVGAALRVAGAPGC